jgi:ABC-type dipeptide/oligopeptide/nickel transport system permease component
LAERAGVYKHALRNTLISLLTIIGLFVGLTLAGAVLIETVFARPGLGKILVDGIGARDYPLVQGAVTVFMMTIILVKLVIGVLITLSASALRQAQAKRAIRPRGAPVEP